MRSDRALAALHRQLDMHGEPCTLQRVSTGATPQTVQASVEIKAIVRPFGQGMQKVDLIGSVAQQDINITLSPREIEAAAWTSGARSGMDARIPIKGNKIIVAGKVRNIEAGHPIYIGGVLVRIELQARG